MFVVVSPPWFVYTRLFSEGVGVDMFTGVVHVVVCDVLIVGRVCDVHVWAGHRYCVGDRDR